MFLRRIQTGVAIAVVVAFLGLSLMPAASAQEEASATAIVVGIYSPQQVAQSTGLQAEVMQQMQGLQQRMQQAQQDADQEAIQQIQVEAQQLQQQAAQQFAADLEAVMPGVAEAAGVQIITTEIAWASEGVTTQDVTQAVIAAMTGDEGAAAVPTESDGS